VDTTTLGTIITSAAIGSVSASLIAIIGQYSERRARRPELLLTKAIELAQARIGFGKEMAEKMGKRVSIPDALSLAAEYYTALHHLLAKDELPKHLVEKEKKSLEAVQKEWAEKDGAGGS
jgi:hypothetical protein